MPLINVLYYKIDTMDENVVFPNNQDPNGQPAQPEQPAQSPLVDPPVDLNNLNAAGVTQVPASEATDPNVVATEQPVDPNVATPESISTDAAPVDAQTGELPPPPPPSKSGLIKKILIGVGVLVVIIFLISLLIPKNSSKEVTIQWWGLWEDSRAVQVAIDDFEKANPTIKVVYVKQDPKQYRAKLLSRIKSGDGPDVFRYHNSWMPMMRDVLLPLSSDVIALDDFKKNYPAVMIADLTRNGAIYGIPLGADSLSLFANTELFAKAGLQVPTTWEDFVDTARKLTVKDAETGKIKTAGAGLGTYNNVSHASDIVSMLFVQGGIDIKKIIDPQYAKAEGTALDFYSAFAKGDQSVWDSTLDESVLAFARGNLALFFGYSWDVFRIKEIDKTDSLKFKVYPVPGLKGGNNATIASYWVEGASARGKNQSAALLFMKYLARPETAQKLYSEQSKVRSFGEPYARVDLAESLKTNELVYPFVSQLPYAQSTYFASDTHDSEEGLNTTLNTYLGNAVTTLSKSGKSADSNVKTLNLGITQVYKKYFIDGK